MFGRLPKRRKAPRMNVRHDDTVRCAGHLQWLRLTRECLISGKHECSGRMEAHHVRLGAHAGMAQKPGDDLAVPLCQAAHRELHNIGQATFDRRYDVRSLEAAHGLWTISDHGRRYRARQDIAE